jgi:hypothetical protein
MMFVLLLLPILLGSHPVRQNRQTPGESSPITATSFRWFRDRQSAEKVVLPPRIPPPSEIEANQSTGRPLRTEGTMVERDPNADKLETRSGSLDRIEEEARESPRIDGFTYEVKFRNFGTKQARTVFWEYQFKEPANSDHASRRRFVCGLKIKSDREVVVQIFSTLGPGNVISVKSLKQGAVKQFDESVVIDRIEFEDGSFWQRQDWNLDEARFAATKDNGHVRVCRSF